MQTFRTPGNRSFGSLHKHHRYPQSADRFGEWLTPSFFPTSPRCRQRPISAAGCSRPASCRTSAAGEPTACLSGTCRRSRQSPREATPAAPRFGVRSGSNGSVHAHCASVKAHPDQRPRGPNEMRPLLTAGSARTPSGSGRPAPGRRRARRPWDRADPPAEVFALVHDVARRRGQRTRGRARPAAPGRGIGRRALRCSAERRVRRTGHARERRASSEWCGAAPSPARCHPHLRAAQRRCQPVRRPSRRTVSTTW